MSFSEKLPTLAVFSHPNHELAILALARRMKLPMVFLTDGGGIHRVGETKEALHDLGLGENATFLPHTEQSFYDALLNLDVIYFARIASELRAIIKDRNPEQILCDAIEFYNPIHDMTLPILVAADDAGLGGVFEVPLIYQKSGLVEEYALQSVPAHVLNQVELELTPEEITIKERALRENYTILRDRLGMILALSPQAFLKETLVPARSPVRMVDSGRVLRYEHRAAALMKEGRIQSEITHAFHYIPVVADLTNQSHR